MRNEKDIVKKLKEEIKKELDEVSDLQVENEGIRDDSVLTKKMFFNVKIMSEKIEKIDELMGELSKYEKVEPISSRDGTFTAYEKPIGMSGVDMDKVRATGLFMWFIENHPECLILDLRKAQEVTGLDLSGYAVRPAYKMYSVSKDEDYRYIAKIISDYRDEKQSMDYEE